VEVEADFFVVSTSHHDTEARSFILGSENTQLETSQPKKNIPVVCRLNQEGLDVFSSDWLHHSEDHDEMKLKALLNDLGDKSDPPEAVSEIGMNLRNEESVFNCFKEEYSEPEGIQNLGFSKCPGSMEEIPDAFKKGIGDLPEIIDTFHQGVAELKRNVHSKGFFLSHFKFPNIPKGEPSTIS
jgi:hypothetical protein